MKKRCLLLFGLLVWLTGCQPVDSLNPLFTDKDLVLDQALEGEWLSSDPSDQTVMKFVQSVNYLTKLTGYEITMTDKDGSGGKFQGYLVSIGGHRFLDVVPENWDASTDSYKLSLHQAESRTTVEPRLIRLSTAAYMEFTGSGRDSKGDVQFQAHLRPAHWFFKVTVDGQKLRLDWVDDDKLKKAIAQGTVHLGNALLGAGKDKDKDIVVTATTKELQAFVAAHAGDDKIFSEHTEFQRRP